MDPTVHIALLGGYRTPEKTSVQAPLTLYRDGRTHRRPFQSENEGQRWYFLFD